MKSGEWVMEFDRDKASFHISNGSVSYCTRPIKCRISEYEETAQRLSFNCECEGQVFRFSAEVCESDSFWMTLSGQGDLTSCRFPGAFLPEKGDKYLYPYGDGIIWDADKELPLPEKLPFYSGSNMGMGLVGMLRGQSGLMMGIEETSDAELLTAMCGGMIENQIAFVGAKGKWAYDRRIRLFLASQDAFNTLCHAYRAWREQMGYVVTLQKKAERIPRIAGMAGRADVWIFDDNNMNRLYGRPEEPEKTPRDVRRIADEMLQLGMDRVLFNSFEGESREDIAYMKERGFEVGRYDVYRDVIPKPNIPFMLPYRVKRSRHTDTCWPQDVRMNENGEYAPAWRLHGTDGKMYSQHSICDVTATRMIMEDVPKFIEEGGYTSWFIDVSMGSTHWECFHPMHPADRRDSIRYKKFQHQFIMDMGLICGVEVGCESGAANYVYSEGMMSPAKFRAPDSGRNMNTLYYGENIPKQITELDLNPSVRIPLWQMIYHDCTVNYWYWGDSSNCCPELMPLRDLYNALYAVPPLYSLNMTQWETLKEQIAESYHRATGTARLAAFSRMVRFDYLKKDRSVQRTTFENSVTVTVNFGSDAFEGIRAGGCMAVDGFGNTVFEF